MSAYLCQRINTFDTNLIWILRIQFSQKQSMKGSKEYLAIIWGLQVRLSLLPPTNIDPNRLDSIHLLDNNIFLRIDNVHFTLFGADRRLPVIFLITAVALSTCLVLFPLFLEVFLKDELPQQQACDYQNS